MSKHKEEIEKKLFYYGKDLFNVQVDVVLYDLTYSNFFIIPNDSFNSLYFNIVAK